MSGEEDTLRSDSHGPDIWLVTENAHKFREASQALDAFGIRLHQFRAQKVEIQSPRLDRIVVYASRHLPKQMNGRLVAMEDSGIFIRSLDGFPGTYSSYVEETIGIPGILRLLRNETDRRASYRCVVALRAPEKDTLLFEGRVSGRISYRKRGKKGFGYDPIFIPSGSHHTFAETGCQVKNRLSHRGRAFRKLARWYLQQWPSHTSGALK